MTADGAELSRCDIVAIGGGFSGLVTACRAAQLGLRALVLEARSETRYPCSSRYSTGVFGVMGGSLMSSPETLRRAIIDGTDGTAKPELASCVADNARRAHDWLISEGARFEPPPNFGAGSLDRSAHVISPARRFGAGLDWDGRGADLLMQRLEANLVERGGRIERGATAEALIVEGGVCIGVDATRHGRRLRIEAKAVVIADGGFAANQALVRRWITPHADRVLARVGPGAKGDGILMAEAAGAAIGGFGAFYGHVHHRDAMEKTSLWPYPHFDAMGEVSLLVGADGKRFTDEGLGGVPMANAIAALADPLSAFILFDEAMWTGAPGRTGPVGCNPALIEGGGWMYSAPDLTTLAGQAGLPAPALEETVRRYNQAVERNDFASLEVRRTTTRWRPLPLNSPPFHAVPLCAGVTGTMGGIEIDRHAQALKPDGSPFPGLYAVGTPVGHLEGGPRAGYVGGLAKGFVLGLLAAEHAAGER
ncbi:MAG TPA: FAD-dependent oxidoreductase [Stellaceae bacterium]|nr:FAD-dependent oxidoreductase [Stellaceae bacterium]